MPPQTFPRTAIPIFDEKTATLRDFDPELADHLASIKDQDLRKVLFTDIDGTAGKASASNEYGIEMVGDFWDNCAAWNKQNGEVHLISARGVTRGIGNLSQLDGHMHNINFTGCNGNEAMVDDYLRHYAPVYDISEYATWFVTLCQEYSGHPVVVGPMGFSVLGVFIEQEHPGYNQFKIKMEEIARDLQQKSGNVYLTKCRPPGIILERADKVGKLEAVRRIRDQDKRKSGIEIYFGNDESDIGAQREVNAKPYGFAYKVFSRRAVPDDLRGPHSDELNADAARGTYILDHLAGLVDGQDQLSRLLGMIAAALRSSL